MTRLQLVARAQLLYNEISTSSAITSADWVSFCDMANQEIARECRTYPFEDSQSLTDGQRTYMIPTAAYQIRPGGISISISGVTTPLEGPIPFDEIVARHSDYDTAEGTPERWYFADELVTVSTETNWAIGLQPVPGTTVANGLLIHGWQVPSALAADATIPSWPTGYHDAIAWGMCTYAAYKDIAKGAPNQSEAIAFYKAEFERQKRLIRAALSDLGQKAWTILESETLQATGRPDPARTP